MAYKKPVEAMHRASNILPVFTARAVDGILTGVTELTPDQASAFIVQTDCTYSIDGSTPVTLLTGDVRGFPVGAKILTFNPAVVIEVM